MPDIAISDSQWNRLDSLRSELVTTHAGPYTSVTPADTIEYLLDLADAVEDPDRQAVPEVADSSEEADESVATEDASEPEEETLASMLSLLETHEEKWRRGSSDEPYEVDLPDGGVTTARTKDDVRAVLFEHYQ